MYVFLTICKNNGKLCVSQTATASSTYLGSSIKLKRAIKKMGKRNFFRVNVYECLTQAAADFKEKFWIKYFNSTNRKNGYNISPGGKRGLGRHSDATKRKIGLKSIGRKHTEEFKQQISELFKGKQLSDEHKQKLSAINMGKHYSVTTLKKLSESHLGNTSALGCKWSDCAKEERSLFFKRRFANKENHPCFGKLKSDATKRKISESLRKRKRAAKEVEDSNE